MDKQRMSNILSSVQMSPRDRKDFIDELSKLGQGGQGGGQVSGEHPVRIIELTQEEAFGEKVLDISYDEYVNNQWIIKIKADLPIYFYKTSIYHDDDGGIVWYKDCYSTIGRGNKLNTIISLQIIYRSNNHNVKVRFGGFGQLDFVSILLDKNNAANNVQVLQTLNSTESYSASLYINDNYILGTYYNGTIIAFVDNKLKQYDVNFETGAITESLSINPELIGTVAKLEVGDADDICQRNLEIINMAITQTNANHFDVDIDYGIGSATFTQGLADDAIAGTATIIVATGYVTKYNLYGNGKVEKVGNDIDLFALEARIAALEGA